MIEAYIKEIDKYDILTRKEERALITKAKKGDKRAYVRLGPDYEALDVATKLGMF